MSPGEYFNQIRVDSPTALNSPQFLPVILEVLPSGANPGPAVIPSELVFSAVAGSPPAGSQELSVYNLRGGSLNYRSQTTTASGIDWITYLPTESSINASRPTRVVVQPDTSRLAPGVEQGVLTLRFDDGSTKKVNILSVVLPPGADPKSLRSSQAACVPAELVPSLTVLGPNFTVPANYPVSIEATVVDNCSVPLTDGTVQVSFSNGDPPVSLISLRDGRWSGTWVPARLPGTLRLTLLAESRAGTLRKTAEFAGSIRSSAATPRINAGGVVNAANFSGKLLAPGSLITIFGSDLATVTEAASALPLETALAGTSVVVGGRDLPMTFVDPNQVNAILPYDLQPNREYQLIVNSGDRLSRPEQVVVAPAQPVIFGDAASPAVIDVAGRPISSANPASRGSVVQIFATGLGAVHGAPNPAEAPVATPTVNSVVVKFAGQDLQPLYAGLTPGFPGLYQVNVAIPDNATPGAGRLAIVADGQTSPEVVVFVR